MNEPILSEENLTAIVELADSVSVNGNECIFDDTYMDGVYACKGITKDFRYAFDTGDLLQGEILKDQITLRLRDNTELVFLVKHPMQLVEPLFS